MTPITKTITAIVFVGLFTLSMVSEAKTNTKGKFHLIYLVSAEKLEVGAKVFVEPLFFTNGNTIIALSKYCTDYIRNAQKKILMPRQISDNIKFIHSYCKNKTRITGFGLLHAVNNTGGYIVLNKLNFSMNKISTEGVALPIFPKAGYASIKHVSRKNYTASFPQGVIKNRNYFFASTNRRILMRIIPISENNTNITRELFQKVEKYAREEISYREELDTKFKIKFFSPIIFDVDNDGKLDLFVGVRVKKQKREKKHLPDNEIMLLVSSYGDNKKTIDYAKITKKRNQKYLKDNFVPLVPFGMVRISKCLYGLYLKVYVYDYYIFQTLNKKNRLCKDIIIAKDELNTVEPPERL